MQYKTYSGRMGGCKGLYGKGRLHKLDDEQCRFTGFEIIYSSDYKHIKFLSKAIPSKRTMLNNTNTQHTNKQNDTLQKYYT